MESSALLRAGYARMDITPPVGVDLTGFIAREGPCAGVLDPLEARALVFEDTGGRRAALVTCDLIGLGRHLVQRVRRRIATLAGIAPEAQLFNCSHTHAGPETGVLTTIGVPDATYLLSLEEKLVEAVATAARERTPVRLRAGVVEVPDGLVVNRVRRRLGEGDRVDHQLTVLRLDHAEPASDGASGPLATIVAFACHAVSLGHGERCASADFVGPLRSELEAAGSGPALYVNGCGGDVNPASMDARGRAARDALAHGLATAAKQALDAAAGQDPIDATGETLAWSREQVDLPLLPLRSAEEAAAILAAGRRRLAETAAGSPHYRAAQVTEVDYALRLLRLHFGSEAIPETTAEVQALRLGPVAVVGLPGEIFNSLGQTIKRASPFGAVRTILAGWTNDNVGYVPDRETYPLGGYEVDVASRYYGYPAGWAPETGDTLVAAASRCLAQVAG